MTSGQERRGGPFPNGVEQREAKLLGPYPTWKAWRHIIEERLKVDLRDSHDPYEPLLHEFYILRRLQQKKGMIDHEVMKRFWAQMENIVPNFEGACSEVLGFIVDNTPIKSKQR